MSDFRCPYPGSDPAPSKPEPFRTPFQADYDRIIYSKPFRRLARKTQVHPLAPNDQAQLIAVRLKTPGVAADRFFAKLVGAEGRAAFDKLGFGAP